MVQRGVQTIKSIVNQKNFDMDELKLKTMRDQIKDGTVYDPRSLDFIFKRLLAAEKISITEQPETFCVIFEMLLSLAVLFGMDQQSKITHKLFKTCQKIVKSVEENLEGINGNEEVMDKIVNSELLKWFSEGLNFNGKDLNRRKQVLVDIQTILYSIQGSELKRVKKEIQIAAKINNFIAESLKSQQIFEEGRKFTYLINCMQLNKLAESSADSWAVKDKIAVYQTDRRMYMNNVNFRIDPKDYIRKIHFNKMGSAMSVKFTDDDGMKSVYNSKRIGEGEKNFILEPKMGLDVSFFTGSLVNQQGNRDYSSSYKDLNLEEKFEGKIVKNVACCGSHALFVLDDESLYAIGNPNTWNNRYQDYNQQKKFNKIEKPHDCVNYRKVVASSNSRVILTKSG